MRLCMQAIVINILMELDLLPISAWRYQVGVCVANDEAGEMMGSAEMLGSNFTDFSTDDDFAEGWNMTERDCTKHEWLWQHPTDQVCMDGMCEGEDQVCIDKVCHIKVWRA